MKKWFFLLWLMCPVMLIYLHFQFSPQFRFEAEIAQDIKVAQNAEKSNEWHTALKQYHAILEKINNFRALLSKNQQSSSKMPHHQHPITSLDWIDRLEIRIKLARAKTLTNTASISSATVILEDLLSELEEKKINDALTDEVRSHLAHCLYYVGWHMRLDGLLRDDWMPELEASRQLYKYLATQAEENTTETLSKQPASPFIKNLEAVIRLERMDLPTLRKLKLPEKGAGKGENQAGIKRKSDKKQQKKKQQGPPQKGKGKGQKPPEDSRKSGFKKYKLQPGS